MTETPPLTIGILTIPDRLHLLESLAASLSDAMDNYDSNIEILVAGNSIDPAAELLRDVVTCPVSKIETDGTAPAGRHRIIETARTDWVLFVDDDCRVDIRLLIAYANEIEKADETTGAVYGPLIFEGPRSRAFEAYRFTPFIHPLQIAMWRDEVEWAPTANALFSTSAVRDVGNFDIENPIAVSGEDVNIGLRLEAAGYDLLTAPTAKVYHTTESWNGVRDNLRRCYTYGLSEAWLVHQYPDRTRPLGGQALSISLASGLLIFWVVIFTLFTIPLLFLIWGIRLAYRWSTIDSDTSLLSYALADCYSLANSIGYVRQTVHSEAPLGQVTRRFKFYSYPYLHTRIREEGVWHASDGSEPDDSETS